MHPSLMDSHSLRRLQDLATVRTGNLLCCQKSRRLHNLTLNSTWHASQDVIQIGHVDRCPKRDDQGKLTVVQNDPWFHVFVPFGGRISV
jgi:hypothetical protein